MSFEAVTLMKFSDEYKDTYKNIERAAEQCRNKHSKDKTHPRHDSLATIVPYRIDKERGATNIITQLLDKLNSAQLVIADVSENNPNVLWETGIVKALNKPLILLTHTLDQACFNLSSFRHIVYRRENIGDSLINPLIESFEAVLGALSQVPIDPSLSTTLATSLASPTYFLSADFTIRYMNEAAVLMFLSEKEETAQSWIGRKVRDFINSLDDRIENLSNIEYRFQIQTEKLKLAIASASTRAYDIERVVFNSPDYGRVELQKTAVAERDPHTQAISGWVVSFNIVNVEDSLLFAKFLTRHEHLIKNRLFPDLLKAVVIPPDRPDAEPAKSAFEEWDPKWLNDCEFRTIKSYDEKVQCFEFMANLMKWDSNRYGLVSVEHLPLWFFDHRNTDYIAYISKSSKALVAVCRLSLRHDLKQYNLSEWVRSKLLSEGDPKPDDTGPLIADAGAYIHPKVTQPRRKHLLAELIGQAVARCDARSHTYLYAQVPTRHLGFYTSAGFEEAGVPFNCYPKWVDRLWVPVLLDCKIYRKDKPLEAKWDQNFIEEVRTSFEEASREDLSIT